MTTDECKHPTDIREKIARGIIVVAFLILLVGAGLTLDAIDSDRRVIPSTSYTASPVQLIFQGQTYGLWPAEISWAEDGTPTYIYRPFDANTGEALSWDDISGDDLVSWLPNKTIDDEIARYGMRPLITMHYFLALEVARVGHKVSRSCEGSPLGLTYNDLMTQGTLSPEDISADDWYVVE